MGAEPDREGDYDVYGMFPAVEVYLHALWSLLKIESKGKLTPDELEWAKEYRMGQAADG